MAVKAFVVSLFVFSVLVCLAPPAAAAVQSAPAGLYRCTDIFSSGSTDVPDFAWFGTHNNACAGDSRFDSRTDFDDSGCTDAVDFEIFKKYYAGGVGVPNSQNPYCVNAGRQIARKCPDIDANGKVDAVDFTLLVRTLNKKYGDSGYDAKADFDSDGGVDDVDKAIFAQYNNAVLPKLPYCPQARAIPTPTATPTPAPAGPDLAIISLTKEPATVTAGVPVTLRAVVKNVGTTSFQPRLIGSQYKTFCVWWTKSTEINYFKESCLTASDPAEYFRPGAESTLTSTLTIDAGKTVEVTASLDIPNRPYNLDLESTMANNVKKITLSTSSTTPGPYVKKTYTGDGSYVLHPGDSLYSSNGYRLVLLETGRTGTVPNQKSVAGFFFTPPGGSFSPFGVTENSVHDFTSMAASRPLKVTIGAITVSSDPATATVKTSVLSTCRTNSDCAYLSSSSTCDTANHLCVTPSIVDTGGYKCTDIFGSGRTDVQDFAWLGQHNNVCRGGAKYDPRVDFDSDGCTDAVDFEIFKLYYAGGVGVPNAQNFYCANAGRPIPRKCPDLTGDGKISATDFTVFTQSYKKSPGQQGFTSRADFDGDGQVNDVDKAIFEKYYRTPALREPYCKSCKANADCARGQTCNAAENMCVTPYVPPEVRCVSSADCQPGQDCVSGVCASRPPASSADLVVSAVAVTPSGGGAQLVTATIRNAGTSGVSARALCNRLLVFKDTINGARVFDSAVSETCPQRTIASGSSVTEEWTVPGLQPGTYALRARADWRGYVSEANEDNNYLDKSFAVGGTPAPSCESVADGVSVVRGEGGCVTASNGVFVRVVRIEQVRDYDNYPTRPVYVNV
ncbi:MAG: dockerin type I domain-containing protein, partial [Candidatus Micrarchaeota archaeon]